MLVRHSENVLAMAQCRDTLLTKEEQAMEEQTELLQQDHGDGTVCNDKMLPLKPSYLLISATLKLPWSIRPMC